MTTGLHNLTNPGRTGRKRLGRGTGSGLGTTAGRGTKGQNSRSGGGVRPRFEGGHTPIYRLLPKLRGFTSRFEKTTSVTLGQLETYFKAGDKVTRATLAAKGLVDRSVESVKLLSAGKLTKQLTIMLDGASAGAKRAVEAAGGTLVLPKVRAAAPKRDATQADKKKA
ncbi:MAG: 50S ribosomal protein L15 [Candidatus Andersenbacteria bacterium]